MEAKALPTFRYDNTQRHNAERMLNRLLLGVGDPRWGRFFRMNLTYCLHRGVSDNELASVNCEWGDVPAKDIAGGPVEVFWSKGIPLGMVSADPCHNPIRQYALGDIWLPLDCGNCPPCQARAAIMNGEQTTNGKR